MSLTCPQWHPYLVHLHYRFAQRIVSRSFSSVSRLSRSAKLPPISNWRDKPATRILAERFQSPPPATHTTGSDVTYDRNLVKKTAQICEIQLNIIESELDGIFSVDNPQLSKPVIQTAFAAFRDKVLHKLVGTLHWAKIPAGDADLVGALRRAAFGDQEYDVRTSLKKAFYKTLVEQLFSSEQLRNHNALADFRYPMELFPSARQIKRTIHLHVGPTNSGKTYNALQRLREAKGNTIYAGPLRMLAHEIYARMNATGKPTWLITGDDKRPPPPDVDESLSLSTSARGPLVHFPTERSNISCTVEMIPVGRRFQVAVIDEIQMLADPSRGCHWTNALLGLCADEIHLCGEERAVAIVQQIANSLGEELHIHRYNRLTQLQVMDNPISIKDLGNLEKGDCLVAFSVKECQQFRAQIEKRTAKKCAIIYGALPSEVRTEQARLFNDPNSEYHFLVATDAIGMGLNLAIRRVILAATWKRGDTGFVQVALSDVKQIGGRAGRFRTSYQDTNPTQSQNIKPAIHPPIDPVVDDGAVAEPPASQSTAGFVTAINQNDLEYVRSCFATDAQPIAAVGFQPSSDVIARFYSYFPPGVPYSLALARLSDISRLPPNYVMNDSRSIFEIADAVDTVKNLRIADRIQICYAPVVRIQLPLIRVMAECVANAKGGGLLELPLDLDVLDAPIDADTDKTVLSRLQDLHRCLVLYSWMSYRFPSVFVDRALANETRALSQAAISQVLSFAKQIQSHDTQTSPLIRRIGERTGNLFVTRSTEERTGNISLIRRTGHHTAISSPLTTSQVSTSRLPPFHRNFSSQKATFSTSSPLASIPRQASRRERFKIMDSHAEDRQPVDSLIRKHNSHPQPQSQITDSDPQAVQPDGLTAEQHSDMTYDKVGLRRWPTEPHDASQHVHIHAVSYPIVRTVPRGSALATKGVGSQVRATLVPPGDDVLSPCVRRHPSDFAFKVDWRSTPHRTSDSTLNSDSPAAIRQVIVGARFKRKAWSPKLIRFDPRWPGVVPSESGESASTSESRIKNGVRGTEIVSRIPRAPIRLQIRRAPSPIIRHSLTASRVQKSKVVRRYAHPDRLHIARTTQGPKVAPKYASVASPPGKSISKGNVQLPDTRKVERASIRRYVSSGWADMHIRHEPRPSRGGTATASDKAHISATKPNPNRVGENYCKEGNSLAKTDSTRVGEKPRSLRVNLKSRFHAHPEAVTSSKPPKVHIRRHVVDWNAKSPSNDSYGVKLKSGMPTDVRAVASNMALKTHPKPQTREPDVAQGAASSHEHVRVRIRLVDVPRPAAPQQVSRRKVRHVFRGLAVEDHNVPERHTSKDVRIIPQMRGLNIISRQILHLPARRRVRSMLSSSSSSSSSLSLHRRRHRRRRPLIYPHNGWKLNTHVTSTPFVTRVLAPDSPSALWARLSSPGSSSSSSSGGFAWNSRRSRLVRHELWSKRYNNPYNNPYNRNLRPHRLVRHEVSPWQNIDALPMYQSVQALAEIKAMTRGRRQPKRRRSSSSSSKQQQPVGLLLQFDRLSSPADAHKAEED